MSGALSSGAARDLRTHFAAGVVVVTSRLGQELRGATVTAFCFAALEPPLALVCFERPSRLAEMIEASGVFAVNALKWRDQFLADRFAGHAPLVDGRFSDVPHHFGATGVPLLEVALAWLDCRVTATWPAGDHTLFLGQIEAGETGPGNEPLVYFRRRYLRFER